MWCVASCRGSPSPIKSASTCCLAQRGACRWQWRLVSVDICHTIRFAKCLEQVLRGLLLLFKKIPKLKAAFYLNSPQRTVVTKTGRADASTMVSPRYLKGGRALSWTSSVAHYPCMSARKRSFRSLKITVWSWWSVRRALGKPPR